MKRLILLVTTVLAFSMGYAAEDELHIVGDFKAKPKNWLNQNGQPVGIMIDLLDEVGKRTGITFTYGLFPWKRAFALSQNGKGGIIGFSKTSERQKHWDYSETMYFDELVLVTTKEKAFDFDGLKSLAGRRLAIKNGASYGDDFEKARSMGYFEIVETTDRTGQMRMLTADRVDVVLVSPGRIALESVIAQNDWLIDHRDDFVILDPPYKQDPNFLGIPKAMNKSHLLPRINKALKAMQEDDTYQTLVDKNIALALETIRNPKP